MDQDERLTVFTATQQGRLYRSVDGGLSWEVASSWAFGVITALAVSANYAGDGTLFVATEEGVFRSLDRGSSWQSAGFGLLDTDILCLACAPNFAQTELLWAGTIGGGFYRSRNAGRAWRESGFGLPDSAIQCLAVSPAFGEDQTLFVGTETAGIFRSRDGGQSWEAIAPELAGQSVNCLDLSPQFHGIRPGQSGYLLAGTSTGLFLSPDGGEQWTLCHDGPGTPLAIAAGESSIVVGSYRDGLSRSEDGGRQWRPANEGIAAHVPPLVGLLAEPSSGSLELVAAALDDGPAYSPDGGATWQPWSIDGVDFAQVQVLAAIGHHCFVATSDKLYHHSLAGSDWSDLSPPLGANARLQLLALSPRFEQDRIVCVATQTGQLYLSDAAGESWRAVAGPPVGEGLPLQAAISFNHLASNYTLNLATAAPVEPHGFKVQLWQSADWGDSWQELVTISPVSTPAVTLAIPATTNEPPLFLAFQHELIKVVKERASQQLEGRRSSLAEGLAVTTLVASSAYETDQTLFAATQQGVFQSSDDGLTWQPLGRGLEGRAVAALMVSAAAGHNRLVAVTWGGEVWRLEK
jgi:photosystem II stability/assembly factor-like uncharacterized protein